MTVYQGISPDNPDEDPAISHHRELLRARLDEKRIKRVASEKRAKLIIAAAIILPILLLLMASALR